ncbi:sulfatase [uncultured Algoriphagus sp.]|uniref:sulfatase n=1 Tax=uncultured Algoriphagus sp. TaxID=417365 RepID=UPI00258B82CE|nr:sulfatase [uncultured Algoriphagus sp.]
MRVPQIVAFLAVMLVFQQSIAQKKDLNILIIHVDDLGASDLGVYGSDFYETPNLDRLAAEGMLFTQSYAAAAICSPTRAALLTGKYPARLGITDWIRAKFQGYSTSGKEGEYEIFEDRPMKTPKIQGYLPLEEVTLPERLQSMGYRTLHIGKWHLGEEGFHPEDQGFDINIGGNDLGQPPSYFDPYISSNPNPDYVIKNLPARQEGEFLTDREGSEIINFIQNQENRFFIHWAPYAVHTPIMGPEDLVKKYQNKQPGIQRNPTYAALIENLDQNVGKVISKLDQLGLRESTLIIFTSDNGGLVGNPDNPVTVNLGLRSFKGYPYEGGVRVPTIVSLPGQIPGGASSDIPIITMDWLPTILDFLETDSNVGDGQSLKSILLDQGQLPERDFFWHFPHYRGADVLPYSIIRSGNYKMIYYFDGEGVELFDLVSDPQEKENLANQLPFLVSEMKSKLEGWWEKTNSRLPVLKEN